MIKTIRTTIERFFGIWLLVAFALGLIIPGVEQIPKWVVLFLQATIILFSCSKIKIADFKEFDFSHIAGFYVFRFIVFPILLFYIANAIVPDYKFALLLLGLLPCGATLPAMMAILGGSSALGLSATTVSGLISPLTIPTIFSLLSGVSLEIDTWGMFETLFLVIICPVFLYFGIIRKIEPLKLGMRENSSAVAISLIFLVIVIVVSFQRERFFQEPVFFLESFLVGFAAYSIFYIIGWLPFHKKDLSTRISYSLLSGNNNIALGISLAVLYLPSRETFILVVWEILWILGVTLFQLFLKFYRKTAEN